MLPITFLLPLFLVWGRRVIRISRLLIWSKTLMELIFNPCCEFPWSPEGPVSQIHSPHLHVRVPWIFSDLLRSVQMLKRERGSESNGTLPHLFNFMVKLQPWFLSLRWKTCLRRNCSQGSCACREGLALGQNTLMIMMMTIILQLWTYNHPPPQNSSIYIFTK